MKVVLVGYMASGKSTIAKILSHSLGINFIDLDSAIALEVGLSIPQIFDDKGELFFRKTETQVLNKLLESNESFVLATGGGTPCYGNNMKLINTMASSSFYLKLPISTLVERILKEKQARPLVANIPDEDLKEFIGKHLFERSFFYCKAENTINCEKKTLEEIVKEIKSLLF